MDTKKYKAIQNFLKDELFLGIPVSENMGDKIGLIAMICYLTNAFKQKKPGITHYEVIRLCTKEESFDDNILEILSLVCEWFAEGCVKFPDLGIKAKDMPAQIKQQIHNLLPF
jgi:cytosine/uracil/thiamine/allantoin permease